MLPSGELALRTSPSHRRIYQLSRSIASLPGPRGWPIVGSLPQISLPQLHLQLERWSDQFGPIYRVALGPNMIVCITDLDTINLMLRERPGRYRRARMLESVMSEMSINGVFSCEGDVWRRQRDFIVSALNPAHLTAFLPSLIILTHRLQRRWNACAGVGILTDVWQDLMCFTVDVTAQLALGIDVNTLETDGPMLQQDLAKIFPALYRRIVAPVPYWRWWRRAADRELDRVLGSIRAMIGDIIANCLTRMQAEPSRYERPTNFLEGLLAARARSDQEMSDDEIFANVITVLLAGEDTTASTIAWVIAFLVEHPDVFRQARAEVDAAVDTSFGDTRDMEFFRQLKYIESIILETIRLKPAAPILGLEPLVDVELLGYHLPAGTDILTLTRRTEVGVADSVGPSECQNIGARRQVIALETIRLKPAAPILGLEPLVDVDLLGYHLPAGTDILTLTRPNAVRDTYFGTAREFCPDRWLSPALGAHNPRAFLAFGAGPRFCPGRALALLEAQSVIAMLCRNFDIVGEDGSELISEYLAFTMHPTHLRVRLLPRRD